MTDKENLTRKSLHRIDLSLETGQKDLLCTVSSHRPKIIIDAKRKLQSARIRSPARLKHLIGSGPVNMFVDMPEIFSQPIFKTKTKEKFHPPHKEEENRSQASSNDRLLYESIGSFDDGSLMKSKTALNIHHPQLSSTKILHSRRTSKYSFQSQDTFVKQNFENLSQESLAATNERLSERIEQLTRHYFPTIQQIRHRYPQPKLPNFSREETKNFMPILSRTRVIP